MANLSPKNAPIKNRVVEHLLVKASELLAHPLNFRKHPDRQKKLLRQNLTEIGHARSLTCYRTPEGLRLIDGHLRADIDPNAMLPIEVLDVTEQEANQLLLTLDPLAALAETDSHLLSQLLQVTPTTGDIEEWLKERAEGSDLFDVASGDLPDLPTGDKTPFQSLTFTLSNRQAEAVKRAVEVAKGRDLDDSDNQSSNGNALFAIVEAYLG